ncbi:MAG: nucleolar RNA-binding Nop10p family protein [Nanoarchaeota archaeon]
MKLRRCPNCETYTLKEICPKCNSKTKDAHYKFLNFGKFLRNNSIVADK